MADLSWFGEAVFASVANRDQSRGLLEDFIERTAGTMPFGGQQNYAAGIELVTQIHLDDQSGPGLRWCYRVPEELMPEAGGITSLVDTLALSYGSGSVPIT